MGERSEKSSFNSAHPYLTPLTHISLRRREKSAVTALRTMVKMLMMHQALIYQSQAFSHIHHLLPYSLIRITFRSDDAILLF